MVKYSSKRKSPKKARARGKNSKRVGKKMMWGGMVQEDEEDEEDVTLAQATAMADATLDNVRRLLAESLLPAAPEDVAIFWSPRNQLVFLNVFWIFLSPFLTAEAVYALYQKLVSGQGSFVVIDVGTFFGTYMMNAFSAIGQTPGAAVAVSTNLSQFLATRIPLETWYGIYFTFFTLVGAGANVASTRFPAFITFINGILQTNIVQPSSDAITAVQSYTMDTVRQAETRAERQVGVYEDYRETLRVNTAFAAENMDRIARQFNNFIGRMQVIVRNAHATGIRIGDIIDRGIQGIGAAGIQGTLVLLSDLYNITVGPIDDLYRSVRGNIPRMNDQVRRIIATSQQLAVRATEYRGFVNNLLELTAAEDESVSTMGSYASGISIGRQTITGSVVSATGTVLTLSTVASDSANALVRSIAVAAATEPQTEQKEVDAVKALITDVSPEVVLEFESRKRERETGSQVSDITDEDSQADGSQVYQRRRSNSQQLTPGMASTSSASLSGLSPLPVLRLSRSKTMGGTTKNRKSRRKKVTKSKTIKRRKARRRT